MSGYSANCINNDVCRPWRSFGVLCLGTLMMIIDGTIVVVAIPSIKAELNPTESSLVWVVDAYLIAFATFMILAGRLGDLFGERRLYLIGMALFTVASLACGLATSPEVLIAGRVTQGFSGAIVSAVSLSLVTKLFTETAVRAKALGIEGLVGILGQGAGLILGGALTAFLGWRWIFLINVPCGIAVSAVARAWLPVKRYEREYRSLDITGAITGAAALTLLTYATVSSNNSGSTFAGTLSSLFAAGLLFILFVAVERRAPAPIFPLILFRRRNLLVANIAIALASASTFVSYFTMTLYLQLVLGYTAFQASLAFLPSSALTVMFSLGPCVSALTRWGAKPVAVFGLLVTAGGLFLLAGIHVRGTLALDVIPGLLLIGIGGGLTGSPLYLAALSEIAPEESGLGSGVAGTASLLGGVIGLAAITRMSTARTHEFLISGESLRVSLTEGYRIAFLAAAILTLIAAMAVALLLRELRSPEQKFAGGA